MKNYFKIFGVIVLAAIIGFSLTACDADDDADEGPPSLEGSWYNAHWTETFTFDVAAGTFTKMSDQSWGERGTFTYTATSFTTTITDITDDGSNWTPWTPPAEDPNRSPVEARDYILSGGNLILNGEWVYVKKN